MTSEMVNRKRTAKAAKAIEISASAANIMTLEENMAKAQPICGSIGNIGWRNNQKWRQPGGYRKSNGSEMAAWRVIWRQRRNENIETAASSAAAKRNQRNGESEMAA